MVIKEESTTVLILIVLININTLINITSSQRKLIFKASQMNRADDGRF